MDNSQVLSRGSFSYSDISEGDIVKVGHGTYRVTDVADQDPQGYPTLSGHRLSSLLPVETIFCGENIDTQKTIVSDMSLIDFLVKEN